VYVAGWFHSGNTGIPGMEGHGTVRKYGSGFPDTVTEIPARDQSLVFLFFVLWYGNEERKPYLKRVVLTFSLLQPMSSANPN